MSSNALVESFRDSIALEDFVMTYSSRALLCALSLMTFVGCAETQSYAPHGVVVSDSNTISLREMQWNVGDHVTLEALGSPGQNVVTLLFNVDVGSDTQWRYDHCQSVAFWSDAGIEEAALRTHQRYEDGAETLVAEVPVATIKRLANSGASDAILCSDRVAFSEEQRARLRDFSDRVAPGSALATAGGSVIF